jgi:diguanylate cyclase (GGDEF)-like protein
VLTANDGAKAWEILSSPNAPRIAIIDWHMPEIDGLQLCQRVRQQKLGHYTYIVLVTSRGRREDAIAGLDAGADEFITKPFHADELEAHLRAAERIIRLQCEIEDSRASLVAVLAHIDSGVVLSDAFGKVIFSNELAQTLHRSCPGQTPSTRQSFFESHRGSYKNAAMVMETVQWGAGAQGSPPDIEIGVDPPRILSWRTKPMAFVEGEGHLDVFNDITAERQLAAVLTEQALTDPLTQLVNRRGGEEGLAREVSRLARGGVAHVSIAMLDIDHFKHVNDTYGHPIGDSVLRLVSQTVSKAIRPTDLAIRWGGEEILLVLSGADLATARLLVDRIRASVAQMRVDTLPAVTFSAGVGELAKKEKPSVAIARADAALYIAKTSGRNRVV